MKMEKTWFTKFTYFEFNLVKPKNWNDNIQKLIESFYGRDYRKVGDIRFSDDLVYCI